MRLILCALASRGCYSAQGSNTDARVYIELSGRGGTSGELRLQNVDSDAPQFQRGQISYFEACTLTPASALSAGDVQHISHHRVDNDCHHKAHSTPSQVWQCCSNRWVASRCAARYRCS